MMDGPIARISLTRLKIPLFKGNVGVGLFKKDLWRYHSLFEHINGLHERCKAACCLSVAQISLD